MLCECFSNGAVHWLGRIPKHQEGIAYSALRIVAFDLAEEKFHFVSLPNIADDPERITFLREDATEYMRHALARNESWDIVILDPPKLAPRRKVW